MIEISAIPPGLILILGGFLIPVLRDDLRYGVLLGFPLITLWLVWAVPDGATMSLSFLGYTLNPVEGDRLSRLFATIFSIMAFAGALYAMKQSRVLELSAAFVYAGSAIGVAFAGDLISMFVFWEIMVVGSTVVLWAAGSQSAYSASIRYVLIHLLGGVLLMVGIAGHVQATGSVDFIAMTPDSWPTWLILAGVLLNTGAPPLSAWIPDAYPEASPGGTVFLSAFTTKTAVYVLIRGFPGSEILIFIGLYMVFYGIIYALLENNMRRFISYVIISQVGFMVTAIGIGTEMALNGAAALAFTGIIYKALLLMSAGSVLHATGKRKFTDLGGLFQSMPLTAICGIIGAMAISSFPITSGFISKSMVSQAAADQQLAVVWFMLMAASSSLVLYVGIKFPWFVFFQKDSGLRPPDPPLNMRMAMILFAALSILLGILPGLLYNILPYPVDYVPYTVAHVVNQLQMLFFAGLAFFVFLPMMKKTLTISLDLDWFYRIALIKISGWCLHRGGRIYEKLLIWMKYRFVRFIAGVSRHHGPEGVLARTWPTGSTVLWVAVLLALYMMFYFF
jgi:multicomponent Na+:H+ antiporter subunit D